MSATSNEAPGGSTVRRKVTVRRVIYLALAVVLGYFGVQLLIGNQDELLGAADLVSHPQLGWLAIAILAEIGSYVTYGAAQKRLLAAQGRAVGLPRLSLLAIAAQALGAVLPAGYAWSNVFSYRIFRRWNVDAVTSGRVLLMSSVLYVLALAALAVVGVQLAGGSGPVQDVRGIAYTLFGLLAVVLAVLVFRPLYVKRVSIRLLELIERRLAGRFNRLEGSVERLERGLADAQSLGRRPVAVSAGWLLLAWIGDIVCLGASFAAIGATPPWRGLLFAYCGAQLAALLPITPGGLGVVEGSLTLALVSYGGGQENTVAAVLLYRLISFWGLVPAGAACYGALTFGRLKPAPVREPDPARIAGAPATEVSQ